MEPMTDTAVILNGEVYATWVCEAQKLQADDINEAIAFYKEITGHDPVQITLHPKNEALAPDGFKVEYLGGVLANEVWMAARQITKSKTSLENKKVVAQQGQEIMSTLEDEKPTVDIIQSVTPITTNEMKRGPKHRQLPDDSIRQWASEGAGSKAIASKLKAEHGITISYKTIQRRLKGFWYEKN
jgi:hypothetical protein